MKLFQRRLKALRMQSPLDRWCAGAAVASTVLGLLALALLADEQLGLGGWIGFCGLLFFPLLLSRFKATEEQGFGLSQQSATLVLWAGLAVFLVLALLAAPFVAVIAWPHGLAAARPRRDSSVALALTFGAFEGLMVAVQHPGLLGSALFALLLIVSLVGGTWLHARTTRRGFMAISDATTARAETPRGLTARSASVGMLAALMILSIAVLEVGIAAVEGKESRSELDLNAIAGSAGGRGTSGDAGSDDSESTELDSEKEEEDRQRRRADRLRSYWPDSVQLQGELQPGQERIMAEVRCSLDGAEPWHSLDRPLYLRARSMDTLDAEGLRSSLRLRGDVLTDSSSGIEDGWIELLTPRPRRREAVYTIRMRDHRVEERYSDRHQTALLYTERLSRIELPSIRVVGDLGIYGEPPDGALLEYRWTSVDWNDGRAIAGPAEVDSRYLLLPSGDARFRAWAADGRALASGAADRQEIVERISAYFADGWTYDRSPARDLHGIDALQQFFDTKRGYCSFYASAALIYLRANRIPCRVVTGYRTTRFVRPNPNKQGHYKVYSSDAHAWVEIALGDGHWRVLEATPSAAYAVAMAQFEGEDPTQLPDEDAAAATSPTGGDADLQNDEVQSPWWMPKGRSAFGYMLGVSVALLAQTLLRIQLRRMDLKRKNGGKLPVDPRAGEYWRRMVRMLRSYGFRPRRGQTPMEFAHLVRSSGGPLFAGIEPVVDTLYRRRFGHQQLDALDLQQLDEYADLLHSKDFRSHWKEITGRGR